MADDFEQRATELIGAGRALYAQGMLPATSGNLSARLSDGSIAITVSGRHKGKLTPDDIMRIDRHGRALDGRRSSAETLLHTQIYGAFASTGVVLHPHSLNATLLSRRHTDPVILRNYELLKAFPGIDTHACAVHVPVFENDQDIARLATTIDDYMNAHQPIFGYLIAGHGFYTWGDTVDDALRHVEAFEFLFACELKNLSLGT